MIGWMAIGIAAAGRWDDAPSDVVVSRTLSASAETIHRQVADLSTWPDLFPDDCAIDWQLNAVTTGVGTRARVRYTVGGMRRPLALVITADDPGRLFEVEHEGDRGWFTQVRYAADGQGTQVTLNTPLKPPPWPLTGLFHRQIRPAFEACYATVLENLAHRTTPGG